MAALPPLDEVLGVLRTAVLPAAAAAAVVYFVASMIPLIRRASIPAALAIACGFVVGNWQRDEPVEWRLRSEHRLQLQEFNHSLQAAITGHNPHGAVIPSPRYWLPWIVAAGLIANVIASVARPLGWVARIAVAGIGGWLLSPHEIQNQHIAYTVGFALLALCIWWLLDEYEGGGLLPFTAALATGAAGIFMLYAHSLRYSDIGVIASAALMGIAVLAWWFRSDAAAVTAVPALGIPGLMLLAQQDTFNSIPAASYSLMACAPLALGLLSLPGISRTLTRARAIVVMFLWLAPTALSLYLAARVETLEF